MHFLSLGIVWGLSLLPAVQVQAPPSQVAKHVRFLASEELKGRRAGSTEADIAARYIAAEFLRLGLEPYGDASPAGDQMQPGRFFEQTFEISMPPQPGPGTRIEWKKAGESFRIDGAKIRALPFSANATVEGELFQMDEDSILKGTPPRETDGLILLVEPGEKPANPHGFRFRDLAQAAKGMVAAALLVVGPKDLLAGIEREGTADVGIPVMWIDPEARKQLPIWAITLGVEMKRETARTNNVLAFLPGKAGASETVVVGAHYDHLGMGGEHSLSPNEKAIHHGADDNASGTAALLEIARTLAPEKGKLARNVLFAAWGAEEIGLLGSAHFVKNPPLPMESVAVNLNLDMVGRLKEGKLDVSGVGTSPSFRELVEKANAGGADLKLKLSEGAMGGFGGSDHLSFYQKGIPVMFFFTGLHADYHKPSDTADKVNMEGVERVAELAAAVTKALASSSEKLPFTKPKEPERKMGATSGTRAWFGSIPEYGDSTDGVHISGASAGSPAEKAGLKAGDIIVRFGEVGIANIYDLTSALGKYKPGDTIEVEIQRGKEKLVLSVTLASR